MSLAVAAGKVCPAYALRLRNRPSPDIEKIFSTDVRTDPRPEHHRLKGSFAMVMPRAAAVPAESVLSVAEVTDGIRTLSDADQIRFKRASQYFSCAGARPAADLRHEAIRRAIAGSRKCSRNLPIVAFLIGVMRSIAYADRRAVQRAKQPTIAGNDPNSQTLLDGPDPRSSPEEQLLRNEQIAEMKAQVLAVFKDDPAAHDLVEGRFLGLEGKELQQLVGLDDKDFATKLRFVRRRVDKAFPDGWKS
jgi:DNA-directed RNA polymerase specialized sigma24 family protein